MLDRQLSELARRAINLALEERREELRADLTRITNDMTVHRMGRSGASVEAARKRCAEEVDARAQLALDEFRRVIESVQAPYTESLEADLKAEIDDVLRGCLQEVHGVISEYAQRELGGAIVPEVREAIAVRERRAHQRAVLEVEHFAHARRREYGRLGVPSDEDLVRELRLSGIVDVDAIIVKLETSAAAIQTNLNTCLTDARIALQAVAEAVAQGVPAAKPVPAAGFGPALTHLRVAGYLTERVEKGIAGLHDLVSEGAHKPLVGLTEIEMAALGRRMAVSGCYFLVKLHNATRGLSPHREGT